MTRKVRIVSICTICLLVFLCTSCVQKPSSDTEVQNFSVDKNKYRMEQMLVLSRHNIRSPLSTNGSVLSEVTNHEWFDWSSKASELSIRGGDLEIEMGQFFRKYLVDQGIMEENWIS